MEEQEIGIYIHIPFCKSKCYYCDFLSFADKNELQERYIKCVRKEIVDKHSIKDTYIIKTIYIGGGTPSVIKPQLIESILKTIRQNYKIKSDAEITIEVNPGTVDREKLEMYKKCGINRLSIGLQAAQDNILKLIGRIHTFEDFISTYKTARDVGFNNINIDLMIGLPSQTMNDVEDSIKKVLYFRPEHLSVYSLMLEDNTKLKEIVERKIVELPSEEEERKMYCFVKKTLKDCGYRQYEISNYAKPGLESKHNLDCWRQNEYLGFGVNASSFIKGQRFSNISNIEEYMENIEKNKLEKNIILEEDLNNENMKKEYMMLGLRTIDGINITKFQRKFGTNPIMDFCFQLDKLVKEDLIIVEDDDIKLTDKGLDFANLVWEEFV